VERGNEVSARLEELCRTWITMNTWQGKPVRMMAVELSQRAEISRLGVVE